MFYSFMSFEKLLQCDNYYDEDRNLLYMPVSASATPYIEYLSGYAYHISESLDYALFLLYTDKEKYKSTAEKIINEVIKYQCTDKNSVFLGCWSYFADEEISEIHANDIAFNCRIAITLFHICTDYGHLFSSKLNQIINEKILNSIYTFLSNYTIQNSFTISLCSYISIRYGEITDHIEFIKYGENLLQTLYNSVMYHNSFYEYNDMQRMVDQAIIFNNLACNIGSRYYRQLINALLDKAWEVLATHFHINTKQISGPFSNTVSDYTKTDVYNFLYYSLGKALELPHFDAIFSHNCTCPEKYLHYFKEKTITGFSRSVVFMGITSPFFRQSIVESNYMQENHTLGSFSRELFWELKRPFIGYFSGEDSPYCFKLDVLHDFHSYSSAAFHSLQYNGALLGHISFVTDRGDKHISLDAPNPKITANDLRIRFSVSGNIESLKISHQKNMLTVSHDGLMLYYTVPLYKFDGQNIKFVFSSDENNMFFDTVIYSGTSAEIDFTKLENAIFQISFLITASGKKLPEVNSVFENGFLKSSMFIDNMHFELETPAKPEIASNCLVKDRQLIGGEILENYVTQLTEHVQDITFLEKMSGESTSFFPFLGADGETTEIQKLITNIHMYSINSLTHEIAHILELIKKEKYPLKLQKRFAIQIVINLFESIRKVNYNFNDIIDRKHYIIYQKISAAVNYETIFEEIIKLCRSIEKEAPIFNNTYKNKNITNHMLQIIHAELLNPDLSLKYISDKLGYSVSHLSRIFFESTGQKYVEYIQSKKIDYAIKEIKNKKLTIKQVSEILGYSNSNNFMRMFSKTTGMTVTQYLSMPDNK